MEKIIDGKLYDSDTMVEVMYWKENNFVSVSGDLPDLYTITIANRLLSRGDEWFIMSSLSNGNKVEELPLPFDMIKIDKEDAKRLWILKGQPRYGIAGEFKRLFGEEI